MENVSVTVEPLGNEFFVMVRVLKFDNIRQEMYWTTPKHLCKKVKTQAKAARYVEELKKKFG